MIVPIRTIHHEKVVTCEEASLARGIELSEELKTLLLKVCKRYVALHIRGCDTLNSKKLKTFFRCKNTSFLNLEELAEKGLKPGIINPWNIGFCDYHIVCFRVFQNEHMATNNSRLDQGIFFDVFELLRQPNTIVGNYGITK